MFTLNPLPESHVESSEKPSTPGTEHGQYGPRLSVTVSGGYASSTMFGYWRWCGKCGGWRKAVGIMSAICCPKCNTLWRE